jgi:hypothetical protein
MTSRGLVLTVLAVLSGCGGGDAPSWTTYSDSALGYSVSFPESWYRATEQLSRISEPHELFTVGTVALSWRATNCEAFAGSAGAGMGAQDVVVTVWERAHVRESEPDFPARPAAFGPAEDAERAGDGCGEPPGTTIHWRNFSDSGRYFHTFVRIGRDASPETAAEAWRVLDSLRLNG